MGDVSQSPHTVESQRSYRAGLAWGLAAYGAWGVFPIYFKAVAAVPALEVLAHRVVWSVVVLAVVLTWQRRWREVTAAVADLRTLGALGVTALLIGVNWYVFIWAIATGRILQSSLGYFINPLVNVFLGVVFLGERMTRAGVAAVAIAALAVGWLTVRSGTVPWVSLVLAVSFALYGLLRKTARVKPVPGLAVETALLAPAALLFLAATASSGGLYFGTGSWRLDLLLAAAGLITALPLLWFNAAAQSLPLSTLGFLQYLSPTGQFLLAVLAYGEPLTRDRLIAFAFIWTALAIFTVDQVRTRARIARLVARRAGTGTGTGTGGGLSPGS
ncbi:MAG TPA: EamA family transporter RarD [Thermoanaerobaculales bacterium]|nr:EamA family transporter RarD [Thermoanaerobaculales bacterium]HPA81528.1 EamA family transporter RarD [Thermoanaerobaculales bacterium]HQL29761.1 EamA family transporter RarD [Thermoanaerobaculales bacterium]HQN97146.1 EamA family transporter RarD [Thermoanaerobaculales bacterium]HQP42342.1 EamA family transporter RarD [Thermoanaerobaculales bacterium]